MMLAAFPLAAGQWHYGASLVCSDCHTQHNSSGGAPMRTDGNAAPARMLLLRGSATELCLSCHDGANALAPDVLAPIGYVAESAAGAFPDDGTNAHDLNQTTPVIPPGGTVPMVLGCTTCHDPHGNDNYRNLRPDPTRTGQTPVTVIARQTKIPGTDPREEVYVTANIVHKSGVSAWCGKCHGATDPGIGHSVDQPLWGSPSASYPQWVSTTQPRVPVHSPSDNVIPSTDDQVMCLSCHKAHGSQNHASLIYADGATLDSTCQECHDP